MTQAIMLAFMEPPPGLEEEFNDWYDTEHLPQRHGLPGFLNAARWVCVDGFPRSLASYDLASEMTLSDPAYQAVSGGNSSPWSRRLLARTARTGRIRMEGAQLWPGEARFVGRRRVNRLLVARYPDPKTGSPGHGAFIDAARRQVGMPELGQLRIFASISSPFPALWLLAEFIAPLPVATLMDAAGTVGGRGADLFNVYVPYSGG